MPILGLAPPNYILHAKASLVFLNLNFSMVPPLLALVFCRTKAVFLGMASVSLILTAIAPADFLALSLAIPDTAPWHAELVSSVYCIYVYIYVCGFGFCFVLFFFCPLCLCLSCFFFLTYFLPLLPTC